MFHQVHRIPCFILKPVQWQTSKNTLFFARKIMFISICINNLWIYLLSNTTFSPYARLTAMQNPAGLQSIGLNSASPQAVAAPVMTGMPALHYWQALNEKGDQSAGLLLEAEPSSADREFPEGWRKKVQNVTPLSKGYCLPDGPPVSHGVNGTGKGERAGEGVTQHSYEDIQLQKWKITTGKADESFTARMPLRKLWTSWFECIFKAGAQVLP